MRIIDLQKDFEEFELTMLGKTQIYKVWYNQTFTYYDIFEQCNVTEHCTRDELTGKTTRHLQGG